MRPIVLLNTIGLTGVDILASELAKLPGLYMLPGQSFVQFKGCLYRPHDYAGMTAGQVFEVLNREVLESSGRLWCGITRFMSPVERDAYDRSNHKAAYLRRAPASTRFFDHAVVYAEAFFESRGLPLPTEAPIGFAGHNFSHNLSAYEPLPPGLRIVNLDAGIALWLAMSGQRMTWNCVEATKFWIVNRLCQRLYARRYAGYLTVDLDALVAAPAMEARNVASGLGLPCAADVGVFASWPAPSRSGFLAWDRSFFGKLKEDAAQIDTIYKSSRLYDAATRFDVWCEGALSDPRVVELLDRYRTFWNSGYQVALDQVGPIENRIVEAVVAGRSTDSEPTLAFRFFHELNDLRAEYYATPVCRVPFSLAALESEIPVPRMPFFLRIVIGYLEHTIGHLMRNPHTYRAVETWPFYELLHTALYREEIARLGLTKKMAALTELAEGARRAARARYPDAPDIP